MKLDIFDTKTLDRLKSMTNTENYCQNGFAASGAKRLFLAAEF